LWHFHYVSMALALTHAVETLLGARNVNTIKQTPVAAVLAAAGVAAGGALWYATRRTAGHAAVDDAGASDAAELAAWLRAHGLPAALVTQLPSSVERALALSTENIQFMGLAVITARKLLAAIKSTRSQQVPSPRPRPSPRSQGTLDAAAVTPRPRPPPARAPQKAVRFAEEYPPAATALTLAESGRAATWRKPFVELAGLAHVGNPPRAVAATLKRTLRLLATPDVERDARGAVWARAQSAADLGKLLAGPFVLLGAAVQPRLEQPARGSASGWAWPWSRARSQQVTPPASPGAEERSQGLPEVKRSGEPAGHSPEEVSERLNAVAAKLNMPQLPSPQEVAATFDETFSAKQVVEWARRTFGDGLILQTSAGIDSMVMLKLVTSVVPNIDVVFVDTGYLPKETTEYVETLRKELNLNLHIARPKLTPQQLEDKHGRLWESSDPEKVHLYGQITKVEPMQRMLKSLGCTATLSGLRAQQTKHRKGLAPISYVPDKGQFSVLPILKWSKEEKTKFKNNTGLPQHPLEAQGYKTVGDAHSSRAAQEGEDERASRFGGKVQECGLHTSTVSLTSVTAGGGSRVGSQAAPETPNKDPKPKDVGMLPALPTGWLVYTRPGCRFCKKTKEELNLRQQPYKEVDISLDDNLAELFARVPGATGVPHAFLNGVHVGGLDALKTRLGASAGQGRFR